MNQKGYLQDVDLVFDVLRKEDLARMRISLINLRHDEADGVLRRNSDGDAFLVAEVPSQHILEQAVDIDHRLVVPLGSSPATPSSIVLKLDSDVHQVPATIAALLDWTKTWKAAHTALQETSIELPTGLRISPTESMIWLSPQGRFEVPAGRRGIWHRILATAPSDTSAVLVVKESLDRSLSGAGTLFLPPPSDGLRDRLFANQAAVVAESCIISSLGGWLHAESRVPSERIFWKHRATLGRDQYAEEIVGGTLFPLKFDASIAETAARTITMGNVAGEPRELRLGALLRSSDLVIPAGAIAFGAEMDDFGNRLDRLLPFKSLAIAAQSHRLIPQCVPGTGCEVDPKFAAFWPMLAEGEPLRFRIQAIDQAGAPCTFEAPLLWVSHTVLQDADKMRHVAKEYNSHPFGPIDMEGQSLHFAQVDMENSPTEKFSTETDWRQWHQVPELNASPSATSLETRNRNKSRLSTSELFLRAKLAEASDGGETGFHAEMTLARVHLSAAGRLVGIPEQYDLSWYDGYLDASRSVSLGVFGKLQTVNEVVDELWTATPSRLLPVIVLKTASSEQGAMAGPTDKLAGGQLDFMPKAFLQDLDITIFGEIKLSDVLAGAVRSATAVPDFIPREVYHDGSTGTGDTANIWTYDWSPVIQPFGPFLPRKDEDAQLASLADRALRMKGLIGLPIRGRPTFRIELELVDFALDFGLLTLDFDRLTVIMKNDAKPEVELRVGTTTFAQHLAFIATLAEFLAAPRLDSNGGSVTFTDDVAKIHYGITTTPLEFGSFSIAGFPITFDASLPLPSASGSTGDIDDGARLTVHFATRSDPFRVIVAGYGGSGFFGFVTSLHEVISLHGSIAFCAYAAMDFGIFGSGEISVSAGIYYKRQFQGGEGPSYVLEGFCNLNGSVSAFQLIRISVLAEISLRYESGSNSMVGEAMLLLSAEVGFFRASTGFVVRREFRGAGVGLLDADFTRLPRFTDRVTRPQWEEYAAAFA